MVLIGEHDYGILLTATAYELSRKDIGIYRHQNEELMQQKLSKELCILFLQDTDFRYYYIPSYDFTVAAKPGEPLDLIKGAMPVLSYFKVFDRKDKKDESKVFHYSSGTVSRASQCLKWRIRSILHRLSEKGGDPENWALIGCILLEDLKRHPLKDREVD